LIQEKTAEKSIEPYGVSVSAHVKKKEFFFSRSFQHARGGSKGLFQGLFKGQ